MDILQSVMDCSSHAMFTMDRQGIVTHINRQAKESFGLFNHSRHAHPAGRLLRGDPRHHRHGTGRWCPVRLHPAHA